MYNVDGTGISVVKHEVIKIVAIKGKKNMYITICTIHIMYINYHVLRGRSKATRVICILASGMFELPDILFTKKLKKNKLLDGLSPGSIGGTHESGWITPDSFETFFVHCKGTKGRSHCLDIGCPLSTFS